VLTLSIRSLASLAHFARSQETIAQGFAHAETITDRPVAFIAYTVKGNGLQTRGHQDNHGAFLNQTQVDRLQAEHGVSKVRDRERIEAMPALLSLTLFP
jgi:pyruvate dehydrogenase E1 component